VLVDHSGLGAAPAEVAELVKRAGGPIEVSGARSRFAVSSLSPPLQQLAVVSVVTAPAPAEGTLKLVRAVLVLTALLLGAAIVVALVLTRAARDDVVFVRKRIADMAHGGEGALGRGWVPVRSLDQVGLLTVALNGLVRRFHTAERRYRDDLQQAAQLDTERSQFLAGLSHELRTPLNAILGFTHLLESDEEPLGPDAREALAMIRTSGEHLKSLIDDILDLSAMETGQLRLSRIAVDVHALAEEVMREMRATVKERSLALQVVGTRHAFAWADPRRARQVLTNLVSNALKATAQGYVRIDVGKRDDFVVVKVEDTGRGMPPDVLATIFEPYRQAGDAAARRGGVGLGLAIARRLVLLHGGTIEARSEVGRGSSFSFSLPDETHATRVPRDSLVPWSDAELDLIGDATPFPQSRRRP
jgi:signal transduction histidine kinase